MEFSAGFSYEIYGLRLDSTRPIPGLNAAKANTPAQVRVSLEGGFLSGSRCRLRSRLIPGMVSSHRDEQDLPNLVLWRLEGGQYIRFRYRDGIEFVLDRGGSALWAQWPASMTLEDTYTYLLGPVLGFLLRQRGVLCLHASLVAVDGQALALLGPVGSGKSTTAAALAQRGCGVLSEDVAPVVPTADGFIAQPGYARIRLWPESSTMLFGSHDCLPKLAPPWEKRHTSTSTGLDISDLQSAGPAAQGYLHCWGRGWMPIVHPFCEDVSPRQRLQAD